MTEGERWAFISEIDDELLKGGTLLSEWCSFIVRDADIAFVHNANLAAILTATSAIETHLRSEFNDEKRETLNSLITHSSLDEKTKVELHALRKFRNNWVHVNEPWDDQTLLSNPNQKLNELFKMAKFAIRLMRKILYHNQMV